MNIIKKINRGMDSKIPNIYNFFLDPIWIFFSHFKNVKIVTAFASVKTFNLTFFREALLHYYCCSLFRNSGCEVKLFVYRNASKFAVVINQGKVEKSSLVFHIYEKWQILKRFSRQLI